MGYCPFCGLGYAARRTGRRARTDRRWARGWCAGRGAGLRRRGRWGAGLGAGALGRRAWGARQGRVVGVARGRGARQAGRASGRCAGGWHAGARGMRGRARGARGRGAVGRAECERPCTAWAWLGAWAGLGQCIRCTWPIFDPF